MERVKEGGTLVKDGNSILKIGVVGQVKAGKSSFLNSLFFDGENVLPRASTPMTAGLTILVYGEENKFEVEYYNKKEWEIFVDKDKEYKDIVSELRQENPNMAESDMGLGDDLKTAHELVSKCGVAVLNKVKEQTHVDTKEFSNISDLQEILEDYVGANGAFTPITKSLRIHLNDERLKGIQVVDTPGVNDPVVSREQRTREFLRESHGVLFLSSSSKFFDSTDTTFLVDRIGSEGIGTVVIVASKFDSVLQDVGMKFRDDLGNAISDCEEKLKSQFLNNLHGSEYNGKDPILSYSSGIGYSIAKKDSDKWDAIEKHVVEQMRNFYPSFFQNETEIKETFNTLSCIEDIRKDYLEGVFIKNKENIIEQKVNSYFENASNNIKKEFENVITKINDSKSLLVSEDIETLNFQEKTAEVVIQEIKSDLNVIVNTTESKVDRLRKECLNNFDIGWAGRLPIVTKTRTLSRETTFLGRNKSFQVSYEVVDCNNLIEKLVGSLNKQVDSLNNTWEKGINAIIKEITNRMSQIVCEQEEKDDTGKFQGRILRNIIKEAIEILSNESTLETYKIVQDFKQGLMQMLTGKDDIPYSKVRKNETEAKFTIEEQASATKEEIRNIVGNIITTVSIDANLKKAAQKSIEIITDKKEELFEMVSKDLQTVIEQARKDLANKESTVKLYTEAIEVLNEEKNKL